MKNIKEVLQAGHQWMEDYRQAFYCEDKDIMFGIQMKEKHTGYVTTNARQLALHLQLSSHDVDLAELIGLLHDVGRFRQWSVYRTFRDNLSEDHAELGLKLIKEQQLYNELNSEDQDILLFAIGNHNKKFIAQAPSERHLLFAKIIRDADKLDIYRDEINEILESSDDSVL